MINYTKCKECGYNKGNAEYQCDVCGKKEELPTISVYQINYKWGNDSGDDSGESHFCSLECLKKIKQLSTIGEAFTNGLEDDEDGHDFRIKISDKDLKKIIGLLNKND